VDGNPEPLKSGEESGIIMTGGDTAMWIDSLTPCMEECSTGRVLNTVYSQATEQDLKHLKGWNFDWTAKGLSDCSIYKLTIDGSNEIEGLVALTVLQGDTAVYVNLAESAPHNLGVDKKYRGVGGHLFAIAANESIKLGFGGFLYLDAKSVSNVC
jgi:hypothetical protein